MSNANTPNFPDFGKLVPGFDFLQNLTQQAAAGSAAPTLGQLPNLGNWIAPTLNVEELDKRIQELKAVQFWLDQNAMALKATIQALEVQKMTLATLKGMNFNMGEVANAFKLKVGDSLAGSAAANAPRAADTPRTFAGLEVPPSHAEAQKAAARQDPPAVEAADPSSSKASPADTAPAAPFADPMQWWGALTQQFQAIATDALQEAARKNPLDAKQSMATGLAQDAVKTATDMATGMATNMATNMAKGMAESASKVMGSTPGWPTPAAAKTAAPGRAKAAAKSTAKPTTKAAAKATAKAPARKAAAKSAAKPAVKTPR